jgi:hypothetical protein
MSTPYNSSDAVDAIPTDEQVASLSQLEVVDQEGAKIRLGSLWESQKTVAVFIRYRRLLQLTKLTWMVYQRSFHIDAHLLHRFLVLFASSLPRSFFDPFLHFADTFGAASVK